MPNRVHVYSGPSLDAAAVRRVLPEAHVHAPVRAGDLVRLAHSPGDVVVLLDGPLAAGAAVRHQEILALVEAGVDVWGAGTLGALRAAELHTAGMHAHGRVARLLLRGVLEGDDEVAVEGDALPLVDVRATCRAACRAGLVDPDAAERVVAAAQALPVARRTWEQIVGHAVDAGLDADMAWRLEGFARRHTVRLTREDALGCLEAVRRSRGAPPRVSRSRVRQAPTSLEQAWREQAAGAELPGAGFVADLEVLDLCRLLAVDYPAFQRRVALQTLAAQAAPSPRTSEREGQAMLRDFARAGGLDVDSLQLWLADRGLSRDDLLAHLRRRDAVATLLRAYQVDPEDEPSLDAALASVVAEHARRLGFVAFGPALTWERAWLSSAEVDSLRPEERMARLAGRAFRTAPGVAWRRPLLQELKVGGVFRVAREAVVQAREHARSHPAAAPEDDEVVAWFVRRWEVRDRVDLALLDRGFEGAEAFLRAARPLVAFDRAVPTYRDLRCLGRRTAPASS